MDLKNSSNRVVYIKHDNNTSKRYINIPILAKLGNFTSDVLDYGLDILDTLSGNRAKSSHEQQMPSNSTFFEANSNNNLNEWRPINTTDPLSTNTSLDNSTYLDSQNQNSTSSNIDKHMLVKPKEALITTTTSKLLNGRQNNKQHLWKQNELWKILQQIQWQHKQQKQNIHKHFGREQQLREYANNMFLNNYQHQMLNQNKISFNKILSDYLIDRTLLKKKGSQETRQNNGDQKEVRSCFKIKPTNN